MERKRRNKRKGMEREGEKVKWRTRGERGKEWVVKESKRNGKKD